jgi:hypothetical protein
VLQDCFGGDASGMDRKGCEEDREENNGAVQKYARNGIPQMILTVDTLDTNGKTRR